MAQYGSPEYWEGRYAKDAEPFDWYQRYSNPIFRGIITTHVPKESAILVPGCGSSTLSEDLLDDGFTGGIASFDISRTVVDDLANRLKDRKGLSFQIMNCTALNFPDACFGAVIDKGALDCLLCGENSTANTGRYTHEVARVLKPGGVFIIVSYAAPELRLSYLEGDYGWFVSVQTIPKPTINTAGLQEAATDASSVHYVYICKKP